MDSVVAASEAKKDIMADQVATPIETRDILDADDVVIGSLSLPEGTAEEVWKERLQSYRYVAPVPTHEELLKAGLKAATVFGKDLAQQAVIDSLALGLAQAPNLLDVMAYTMSTQNFLMTGSLNAALADIDRKLLAGIPGNLSPFVTVELITARRDKIRAYLGIALD